MKVVHRKDRTDETGPPSTAVHPRDLQRDRYPVHAIARDSTLGWLGAFHQQRRR
jgi:hypothetical protein